MIVAANITPDRETGIGAWSDGEKIRAIREGIDRDGRVLFPMMPYVNYRRMSDEDVYAIVAYMNSLPAVRNSLPATSIKFPVSLLIKSVPQPAGQVAQTVMHSMDRLPGGNCRELRELIERSARSMLIRAAGETPDLYTRDYLAELETHSPFRFTFLNDRRTRLESRKGILNRLFEAFLAGDEDEPAFPLLPSSLMPRF